MALVVIQASRLSAEQKKRIGDHVIDAFHREGIPASSVVVLFQRYAPDIVLDGGLLFQAAVDEESPAPPSRDRTREVPVLSAPTPMPMPTSMSMPMPMPMSMPRAQEGYPSRVRRSQADLAELRAKLVMILQTEGVLTSFQAQERLGLKDYDWAPAALRRFFSELEEEGVITKQGQKRGTRYLWKGLVVQPSPKGGLPKLVKKTGMDE